MPIIFSNASYPNLTTTGGTPGHVTYIGRLSMFDPRIAKQLDFTHLAEDLVYSRLWLPLDAPAEFEDIERLAIENDQAEMRRVKNLAESQRLPQIGVAIINALPPDREVTLDEAAEIAWQIVHEVRQGYRLAVYLVIHDPALKSPDSKNRHAHIFVLTRELGRAGLAPTKIRGDIASVRSAGGLNYVAEGVNWPDLTAEVLRSKLLEFGLDITPDLIAPHPQKHLRPIRWSSNTGRFTFHRAQRMDKNVAAIHGNPSALLDKLLRNRTTLEIEELRRFVAKCIDSRRDREEAVDRILTDPEIVTLADSANKERPRFITTAAIHASIEYAVELVDRSKKGTATIHATVGADHAAVIAAVKDLMKEELIGTNGGILIIGERLSDCADMAEALAPASPERAAIKAILADVRDPFWRAMPANGLVILPRAERVGDQDLARLLDLADRCEAHIVLGKDLAVDAGVVASRLACHAVEALTSFQTIVEQQVSLERLLRAGMMNAAIRTMRDRLTFKSLDESQADRDGCDFVVCTNNRAVKSAEEQLAAAFGRKCAAKHATSFVANITHGPALLWQWQPIVFTQTDYSVRPPKIREGQIATIFSIDGGTSTVEMLLSDGQVAPLSIRKFPWFRSAFALSIREARQIREPVKLRIEIGDARRAWPALLLAATQSSASVVIDPSVARHPSSLAVVLSGTLPVALPTELFAMPDTNAEISAEIARMTADWLEPMLVPDEPKLGRKHAPPISVADNVRELLASDQRSARAFQLLCKLLHPKSGCSEEVSAKLQTSARLTTYIVNQLREAYRGKKSNNEKDDWDDPRRLNLSNPQPWTTGDISELRSDFFAMTFRGSNLDITSIAGRREPRRFQSADQLNGRAQSSANPPPGDPRNSSP